MSRYPQTDGIVSKTSFPVKTQQSNKSEIETNTSTRTF